ncbi:hypothetical protein SPIRO4BDMA_40012 [uncultured spirochete]|uniref:Uncharacterized protein n=1 Tax=uncultured spirochete TaxID=156406 RepID=A0A3P3XNE8_9SPIR|nr:hypothetical protein SPIRO4BDMA_40012 [uncultured spirochete]
MIKQMSISETRKKITSLADELSYFQNELEIIGIDKRFNMDRQKPTTTEFRA